MLQVTLPGTAGTMPRKDRWLSCLYARTDKTCFLFDCGEGTQVALRRCGLSLNAIDYICISHYHADHISGLPGLLLSMGNEERRTPVHILGPAPLSAVFEGLRVIVPELPFPVILQECAEERTELAADGIRVTAVQARHTLPCLAYRLDVLRRPRFLAERAEALGLPRPLWSRLQKGETVEHNGGTVTPDAVLGEDRRGISLVYCTDSRPTKDLYRLVAGADLLVCEGMYGEEGDADKAKKTGHMTFTEAAKLAAGANPPPRQLWLTHFSPSLQEPEAYAETARARFPATEVGFDGMTATLRFSNED